MTHHIDWSPVTADHVTAAMAEYDRLGAVGFFAQNGFAPATTYELIASQRSYPPKAVLGRAYELATGSRLVSTDFEGGKSGAVKVLGALGFDVRPQEPRTH